MDEFEPLTKKVVLLGASDAGKSSLVLRFVKGKFFERRENLQELLSQQKLQTQPENDQNLKFGILQVKKDIIVQLQCIIVMLLVLLLFMILQIENLWKKLNDGQMSYILQIEKI
eukprot:TRINITY_DN97915_c0_g1_i1.p2 TRINITY_DN97915_c0_g1~~TRINITY_DN97915_c0_g1_i1.p2  ORF type:complete len:129 (+),score=2.18 TRINITY_DN97915_c0_g1_i1:47-388(+)